MLVFTGVTISFFVQSHNFTFGGFNSERLGLVLLLLMSAIGGILLTALLHGDFIAVLCSGFQYWMMMPCFFNMLQMNAFCNADDISWGTKNLVKSGTHEAVKTKSKKLAYRVRPTRTSKAFWSAMNELQAHMLDARQVAIYNARKEAKLRAFASYLLIAWVGTNVILVGIILMVSNYEWEVCAVTESEMAVSAIRTQAEDYDKALAIADLVQTAVTILQRGAQLYPFEGLQGFPQVGLGSFVPASLFIYTRIGASFYTSARPPLVLPGCHLTPSPPPRLPAGLPDARVRRRAGQRGARVARDGPRQRDRALQQPRPVDAQV
jgi:chitin synthase